MTDQYSAGLDWTLTPNQLEKEWQLAQDLDLASRTGSIIFNKTLFEKFDISSLIELWKEDKRVNILANPRVMTLDNLTATIELVEQIPYTMQSDTSQGEPVTSTQFKEAGIKLYVTPHITTKENYISMNIKVEQSFRSGWTADNQPIIDSRKAETNLMVKDGETIVIGGLRKKEDSVTIDKIPVLGDIPFVGALFRKTVKDITDVDLLIFVTPRVVTKPQLSQKEKEKLQLFPDRTKFESTTAEISEIVPAKEEVTIKKEPFSLRPPD
jgi:type II secretory pathway component GspD/PulD (secretin)